MLRRQTRPARRRLGVASLVAAAALAGSAVPSPASAGGGVETVVGPLPDPVRAVLPADAKLYGDYQLGATPELCRNGAYNCVDTTIRSMYQRWNPLDAACHHSAVFSLLYLRVTEQYRTAAATPDYFVSPLRVNTEDADFGALYLNGYDNWYAAKPATVPPVWRLAYAAADKKKNTGSGDAFLGMVAHIKRDLPFALYRIARGDRTDHLKINDMLKEVYPTASVELARRYDSTMSPNEPVPGMGEALVDAIATWREQAWIDAGKLLDAPDATAFNNVAMGIEKAAWDTALTIYTGTQSTALQTSTRDAYCAAQP